MRIRTLLFASLCLVFLRCEETKGNSPFDGGVVHYADATQSDVTSEVSMTDATQSDAEQSDRMGDTAVETDSSSNTDAGAELVDAQCSPGVSFNSWDDRVTVCRNYPDTYGIPNLFAMHPVDIALDAPMEVGIDFSYSVNKDAFHSYSPMNLELWGANSACGPAETLLWFGPVSTEQVCTTFVPDKPYTNILEVYRPIHPEGSWLIVTGYRSLCPNGTCPLGGEGMGLRADGIPLEAPVGYYEGHKEHLSSDFVWYHLFGNYSGRLVFWTEPMETIGVSSDIIRGFFEMPTGSPLSDATYCIGENSSVTIIAEETLNLSIRDITRMSDLIASGIETVNVSDSSGDALIESTLPGLTSLQCDASVGKTAWRNCKRDECILAYFCDSTLYVLHLYTEEPDGADAIFQSGQQQTFVKAELLFLPWESTTEDFRIARSASGSIIWSTDDSITVNLDGVTQWLTCPGTTHVPVAIDFILDESW